jgi:hypothetical protein
MKRELPRKTWNGPITRAVLVLGAVSVGALDACGASSADYGAPAPPEDWWELLDGGSDAGK